MVTSNAWMRGEYTDSPTAKAVKAAMDELEKMSKHSMATPLRKQFYLNTANLLEELEARILMLEADLELTRTANEPYVPRL